MYKAATVATLCSLSLAVLLFPSALAWGQATINVPGDQLTIQAGINAANNGDTVLVAPGKYVENIDFMGKTITVTSSGGAATTILDGGATGPTVTFQTSEPRASILSGFTIQNGGGYGTNTTSPGIGGVVVSYASPTIQNNVITQNQCWDIEVFYGAPMIQGNTISSTQSPTGGCGTGSGAGINVNGNLDGDASSSAGSPAIIKANIIEDITVPSAGGAPDLFTNLDSEDGGAGISILAGSPVVEDNIIRNNSAPGGNGGGINVAGGAGSTIAQNLIYGNSAGCGGGAISFSDTYTGSATYLLVANNTIADNTAASAGPYTSCGDAAQIYGVNFGLSSPHVVFVNNVVSGNTAAPAVGCFSLPGTPSETDQSIFDHNLLYNAGGSFFGPTCIDVSAKYGNVAAAAQFVNDAQGDFHLLAASPGIDTGNNSALGDISELSHAGLAADFDGNPRVQDATGLGYPTIDLGAYELGGAVDGTPTTIVLTASTYAGTPGNPLMLTALAKSGTGVPSGSLTFFLDGQQLGTAAISSQGYATLNSVVPGVGAHSLYAAYQATGSFTAARSVIIIVTGEGTPASKTYTTSLAFGANINPQTAGQGVTFTTIASSTDPNPAFEPSPITLTLGNGAVLASLTPHAEGIAEFTTETLPVGLDVVAASYAGDATHQAASASFTENITGIAGEFVLYCSPMTITIGQTAGLTVDLSETGGTVIFRDNGVIFSQVPVVSGTVSQTYTGRSVGTHSITATYPPFGLNAGSSAACYIPDPMIAPDIIVVGLPSVSVLSVTPPAAIFQTTRTLTATVSPANLPGLGTPTGTVSFLNGTTPLGTVNLAGGVAVLNTIALPAGTDSVTCSYLGDSIYDPSNCNTVTVNTSIAQASLALSSSANPAPALTPVTFTVQLLATGQLVPERALVVVSVAGQNFDLTLDPNGMAGVVLSTLTPGTYPVTASFAGNANLLGTTASLTETITTSSSTTALSAAPSPGYVGQPVTLTAMVTAQDTLVPTGGTVTFYDGTTLLGTGTLDQTRSATLTTSTLAVGTHSLTASYAGAGEFTGSISPPFSETILAAGTLTTTALAASPNPANVGQTVTLTAVVTTASTQVPAGGTVVFYDGTTVLGTAALDQSRTAVFTTSTLAVGTHTLTASYAGSTSVFGGSTSASVLETILASGASSFSIALSPSAVTVPADQTASIAIQLSSIGGFAGPLTLSYGTLPVNASASIVPTVVTLTAGSSGSATLSLFTATPTTATMNRSRPQRFMGWPTVLAAGLILLLPRRKRLLARRRGVRLFFWLALTSALLQTVTGCGSTSYTLPGVAPGTYQIPVTATDVNQNKQTAMLTLVVPPQ